MHGIGFNVNSDLSYFSHIIPCGIDDKAVTSMEIELGKSIDIKVVSHELKHQLSRIFEYQYI
jgi:lipoyl(octanoyl) transferase